MKQEADNSSLSAPVKPTQLGMVSRDTALHLRRFQAINLETLAHREGRVRGGKWVQSPTGGRCKLYAVEDLKRLREEMRGDDALYKDSKGHYHVPSTHVRRQEAWRMFGVNRITWLKRSAKDSMWRTVPGGPKIYAIEDLNRMLDEFGRLAPPYPDPERPGCYRVPLFGRDIHQIERRSSTRIRCR